MYQTKLDYKILHGVDNVDYDKYFTLNKNSTKNNGYKLKVKMQITNTLGNSFNYRVVKILKSLPSEVVASETVGTFKNRLDRVFERLKLQNIDTRTFSYIEE